MIEDWEPLALCKEVGPEFMWAGPADDEAAPKSGRPGRKPGTDLGMALALCEQCPVRLECLTAALREEAGQPVSMRETIRGGMTPGERFALEASRGKCADCGKKVSSVLCLPCSNRRTVRDATMEAERLAWRRTCLNCGDVSTHENKHDYCRDCTRVLYNGRQISAAS